MMAKEQSIVYRITFGVFGILASASFAVTTQVCDFIFSLLLQYCFLFCSLSCACWQYGYVASSNAAPQFLLQFTNLIIFIQMKQLSKYIMFLSLLLFIQQIKFKYGRMLFYIAFFVCCNICLCMLLCLVVVYPWTWLATLDFVILLFNFNCRSLLLLLIVRLLFFSLFFVCVPSPQIAQLGQQRMSNLIFIVN